MQTHPAIFRFCPPKENCYCCVQVIGTVAISFILPLCIRFYVAVVQQHFFSEHCQYFN